MLKFRNPIHLEIIYPDGTIEKETVFNGLTDEGRQYLLDTALAAGSQLPTWYIGLIASAGFTAVDDTDTMGAHAGWTEEVAFTEAGRLIWVPVAQGNALVNTLAVSFNYVAEGTLEGILVSSDATKGGSIGTLWATGVFAASRVIPAGTAINIIYQVEAV
jgi:hypothetical protein